MRTSQLRRALPALTAAALLATVAVLGSQRTAPPLVGAGDGDVARLVEIGAGRRQQPIPQPTALLVSATNAPLRVFGSDGLEHLEYDLILTNVFAAPVTLTVVEVVAPDGQALLRLEGDALAANIQSLFFSGASPGAAVPVGGVIAVVIDVVLPPGQAPARFSHRITYTLPADARALTLVDSRVIAGPELTVDPRAPLVIAPPLRGPGWFNANGCCLAGTPHRAARLAVDGARYAKFEMFAIDWLQFQDGRLFLGDGSQNEQYFAFGAEVVSVADGTVVAVRDGMPEETPNQPTVAVHHPDDYAGNRVVVQLQPDVWVTYAHLQPDSIAARVGDRVTVGQLLGRLGNTGNSTAPHLHFQLSDGPDVLTSNSLPYVFDRYTLAGTVEPERVVAAVTDPSAPSVALMGPPAAQTGTYPLALTVQDFR
jgi:hypothetical protein